MSTRMKKTLAGLALAGVAALAAAGLTSCAEDGASAEGGTVKVMVFGSFSQPPFVLPQIETGAKAATEAINADGGLAGQQIELISCDDESNPNGATTCGRQAVDEGVVAVVGTFSLFTDNIMPLLTEAGIPFIHSDAMSQLELTSENSFPLVAAMTPNFAAMLSLRDNHGCNDFVVAAPQSATSEYAASVVTEVSSAVGIETKSAFYPPDETDFTSVAAQVIDASKCVILGGGSADSAALMTALSQSGTETVTVALSTIALPDSTVQELGDIAEGTLMYTSLYYPSTGEEAVLTAVENIKAVDENATIDEVSLNAYAGMLTLQQAAGLVEGELTGQAVIDVLNSPDTVIDTGMFEPVSWGVNAGLVESQPRVAGVEFIEYQIEGGEWIATGNTVSLVDALG